MKKYLNHLLFLAGLLPAWAAGPALAQSTHSFNSGMNCYGCYKLPDTSTRPYRVTAGDDSYYQPVISSPSYTNNGNGTVTDNVTGLMWVRSPGSATKNWQNALSSCSATTAGNMNYAPGFAGKTDWRLPNVRELMSIMDHGSVATPYISAGTFPGTQSGNYWTSTTFEATPTNAWYVDFLNGIVWYEAKNAARYVRCVRGPD
jgi:hypothetical protein